ncbi:DMT family transporter [Acinetobacter baumannii]
MIAAVIIDQFALLNAPLHTINWQRLIGVALLIGGVYLVKKY